MNANSPSSEPARDAVRLATFDEHRSLDRVHAIFIVTNPAKLAHLPSPTP